MSRTFWLFVVLIAVLMFGCSASSSPTGSGGSDVTGSDGGRSGEATEGGEPGSDPDTFEDQNDPDDGSEEDGAEEDGAEEDGAEEDGAEEDGAEEDGDGDSVDDEDPDAEEEDVDAGVMTGGSGESCADPEWLEVTGGQASDMGSSVGAAHDHDGPSACSSCGTRVERVYAVPVPAGGSVSASYYSADGTLDCVSVQNACPQSLVGGFTCGDPTSTLETSPREFPMGGTAYVFLWMDGDKDYELTIDVQ